MQGLSENIGLEDELPEVETPSAFGLVTLLRPQISTSLEFSFLLTGAGSVISICSLRNDCA